MTIPPESNESSKMPETPEVQPLLEPDTSLVSEMLTPSELAQLRHAGSEADAYLRKAYPTDLPLLALRPYPTQEEQAADLLKEWGPIFVA